MTRVRVVAPTGRAQTPVPLRPPSGATRHAAEDDAAHVYLRSLLRTQLRLALVVALGFLLIAATFSVLLVWVPWLRDLSVLGIPFEWLLLGAGLFPVILLSAVLYTRLARRNEERYRDLIEDR
ncbi:O-antigen/teichoic acid export membrane protein [Arthrobacter woluwensis]|uniref:hypothetical protein n=1 Tax=Arthrobacter woluwensis TaxID=156980 RepID=UPI00277E749A|nr:hypothetical protein [Arthrobacter woluwensis]MDQ0708207.1 O-antigen/teichoic acid export membrane protein [Arthrobacter woluwensis]